MTSSSSRHFQHHSALKASPTSSHFLDLRRQSGFLKQRHADLPPVGEDEKSSLYIRHSERFYLPQSYRTGLAFFGTVLMVALLTVSTFKAQSLAQRSQELMQAQAREDLQELNSELLPYSSGQVTASNAAVVSAQGSGVGMNLFVPGSVPVADNSLRELTMPSLLPGATQLTLRDGARAFGAFVESWQADANPIHKLDHLQLYAEKAAASWLLARDQVLTAFGESGEGVSSETIDLLEPLWGLSALLEEFEGASDRFQQLLGRDEPQRVAIFFQDPSTLRASGGVLSAGVEIVIDEGELVSVRPFHVQESQSLLRSHIEPPFELRNAVSHWDLGSANSFLSFSRSAQQMHWFWQRQVHSSLDHLIVINTTALDRFFQSSGLLERLDPKTAAEVAQGGQQWTSWQRDGATVEQKAFVGLVFEQWQVFLQDPELVLRNWPLVKELIEEKQVLVHSFRDEVQQELEALDFAAILSPSGDREDLLFVGHTNRENRSDDRWIQESRQLKSFIPEEDGTLTHRLRLERRFAENAPASARHAGFTKVLVPLESQLLSSSGVDLADIRIEHLEHFSAWSFESVFEKGDPLVIELEYQLPWQYDVDTVDNYKLKLVTQAGVPPVAFDHEVILPEELQIFHQVPKSTPTELRRNEVLAVVIGKRF